MASLKTVVFSKILEKSEMEVHFFPLVDRALPALECFLPLKGVRGTSRIFCASVRGRLKPSRLLHVSP